MGDRQLASVMEPRRATASVADAQLIFSPESQADSHVHHRIRDLKRQVDHLSRQHCALAAAHVTMKEPGEAGKITRQMNDVFAKKITLSKGIEICTKGEAGNNERGLKRKTTCDNIKADISKHEATLACYANKTRKLTEEVHRKQEWLASVEAEQDAFDIEAEFAKYDQFPHGMPAPAPPAALPPYRVTHPQ